MRSFCKLFFVTAALCTGSFSYAVDLQVISAMSSHGPEMGLPPKTLEDLKDEVRAKIMETAGTRFRQVSKIIEAEAYCEPVYMGSRECYRARVVLHASFVDVSHAEEPWEITVSARANPWDRSLRRAKALEQAKASADLLCGGAAQLLQILDEEDSWDPTYYEVTGRYSCVKP